MPPAPIHVNGYWGLFSATMGNKFHSVSSDSDVSCCIIISFVVIHSKLHNYTEVNSLNQYKLNPVESEFF